MSSDGELLAAIRRTAEAATDGHGARWADVDALLRIVDQQAAIIRAEPMLEWQQSYDSLKAERDALLRMVDELKRNLGVTEKYAQMAEAERDGLAAEKGAPPPQQQSLDWIEELRQESEAEYPPPWDEYDYKMLFDHVCAVTQERDELRAKLDREYAAHTRSAENLATVQGECNELTRDIRELRAKLAEANGELTALREGRRLDRAEAELERDATKARLLLAEAKLAEAEKTDRRGEVAILREAVVRIDDEKRAAIARAEAAEARVLRLEKALFAACNGHVDLDALEDSCE